MSPRISGRATTSLPHSREEVHSALRKEPADRPQSTTEYVRRVSEAGRVPPA